MTERELLELAAKAAGIELVSYHKHPAQLVHTNLGDAAVRWNPLVDDGDALRLAVKLGLTICNEHESAGQVSCTRADSETFPVEFSGNVGDPPGITPEDYAATRRAIVRAAAEIGRQMK